MDSCRNCSCRHGGGHIRRVSLPEERQTDECERSYYIQDGEMVSSEGSWRLTFDKNKGTTLKGHGVRKNLTDDGTVIYYKLENKVLLPQTDCLQFAAEDKIYRLEYFSTVELVEGGGYRIKDGSTSVVVPDGIIYDGKDTYLFLEPVELTVDEETIKLPALSMIHAEFANLIEIYPYGYEPSKDGFIYRFRCKSILLRRTDADAADGSGTSGKPGMAAHVYQLPDTAENQYVGRLR